jgi:LysM repeat protein
LGRHRKPARIRIPQGAATAAPAIAGVAVTLCMTSQAAPADAATTPVSVPAVLATAQQNAAASLLDAWKPDTAVARRPVVTHTNPATYRVRPGDSLSSIAERVYHDRSYWPVIYWRNHRQIRWANEINAGQVLQIPAKPAHVPAAPGQLAPPLPATAATPVASADPAPTASVSASYSGAYPGGAFGECVVARESGGNAQVMNSTGHYGLYQFSAATWAAYGGNPADFGDASVAEQNQVFANALAAGGESNWSAYDGC